jgi:acyl-CoA reductase-like NAD-dependent aldehyde dehydrogenase
VSSSPERGPSAAFVARLGLSAERLVDRWCEPDGLAPFVEAQDQVEAAAASLDTEGRALRSAGPLAIARMLHAVANDLSAEREDWARLIAAEAGKPLSLARIEVERGAATFALAAEEALRDDGAVSDLARIPAHAGLRGEVRRAPRGPVLAITPFNFPLNLVAHKVAPALALGVPVLVKPSPHTPLTAHALAALVARHSGGARPVRVVEADVPGTLALVDDARLPVVSFTGSAQVGWSLRARAPRKRVLLELGGTAPAILGDDVRVTDALAATLAASAFGYAGQVCIALQRVITLPENHDEAVEALAAAASRLHVEDPLAGTSILGPMITRAAAARVDRTLTDAEARGCTFVIRSAPDRNRLGPAIAVVPADARGCDLVREEIFGPALCVQPARDWDEAYALANDGPYGLHASVYTDSFKRVREAFDRLDFGGVVVNEPPSLRSDAMPYGGTKASGEGREGVRFAMNDFTDPRILLWREGRA